MIILLERRYNFYKISDIDMELEHVKIQNLFHVLYSCLSTLSKFIGLVFYFLVIQFPIQISISYAQCSLIQCQNKNMIFHGSPKWKKLFSLGIPFFLDVKGKCLWGHFDYITHAPKMIKIRLNMPNGYSKTLKYCLGSSVRLIPTFL